MEVLRQPPDVSAFVPLAEHQSATPASFHSGPPILHYHSDRSKVRVLQRELTNAPAFVPLFEESVSQDQSTSNGDAQANGDSEDVQVIGEVDVWVTSAKLFLYSFAASAGVSIPYPTISLHAIQTLPTPTAGTSEQGVYMQLLTSGDEPSSEDAEPESLSITIVPTASAPPVPGASQPDAELETEDKPEQMPVQALFNALSECANLHPDPVEDGDEEDGGSRLIRSGLAMPGDDSGGLPPPMPGSGGWVTAENMHEFIDADGNWIEDNDEANDAQGEESLGPGAGTVRTREDDQDEEGENGEDDTKWQRTA